MAEENTDENFGFRKNALALRLQQRRSRKVLADQGIIPPLKSPGTYFEQVQRLERARKEDYLNKAIQIRPNRDMLVQKHILEDTAAAGLIVANQKDLKKAKLVDDLNDKIALRPGVIELVERNIFPANEDIHEALKGGHVQYKKIADFIEEDSSDAFSPEQHPPLTSSPPLILQLATTTTAIASVDKITSFQAKADQSCYSKSSTTSIFTQGSSHPYLSRQTSKGSKLTHSHVGLSRISNTRKKKDKPKMKKFKYHQYIPPDQVKHGKTESDLPSLHDDTPYSRLLQQQQLYLQLQIMNNQRSARSVEGPQSGSFQQQSLAPPPPPLVQSMKIEKPRRTNTVLTQSKLDEMKVSEMKEELKLRGLKVTGTKEVLAERLKPFCVRQDNLFLSDLCSEDSNSAFDSNSSSCMVSEMSYPGMGKEDHPGIPSTLPPTEHNGVSTAYPIDPSAVFTQKISRMPVPEQHKVILKQEKVTMPTWHPNPEPSHSEQPGFGMMELSKDKMLEKQQKEINDLKRMVELHRSQLQQLQIQKELAAKSQQSQGDKPSEAQLSTSSFEFPTASHHQYHPSHYNTSHSNSTQSQTTNPDHPPNYDQAYEMLNENGPVERIQAANRDMEDLLELLTDNGEIPPSPVVTRQLLNDHPAYHGLNNTQQRKARHTNHYQPGGVEYSVILQEQAQLLREVQNNRVKRPPSYPNKPMGQYTGADGSVSDLTKMLVDSAGDALMDTSNFPPVSPPQQEFTHHSARNSVDSGILYSTPHFSPMDTNVDAINKDMVNDLRLSTSSLDSGEQTLNTVGLSPMTSPRMRHPMNVQPNYHPISASPRSHNYLTKSASQELLSSNEAPQGSGGNTQMENELGWLDLTLGSAVGGPPSPGGPFGNIGFEEHPAQHSRHLGYNGVHEGEIYSAGSTGTLNYTPCSNSAIMDPQWDSWEGLLSPSYNT